MKTVSSLTDETHNVYITKKEILSHDFRTELVCLTIHSKICIFIYEGHDLDVDCRYFQIMISTETVGLTERQLRAFDIYNQ